MKKLWHKILQYKTLIWLAIIAACFILGIFGKISILISPILAAALIGYWVINIRECIS